jgi:hypothetical protein
MVALTTRVSFGQGSKQKPYPLLSKGPTGFITPTSLPSRKGKKEKKKKKKRGRESFQCVVATGDPPDQSRCDLLSRKSVIVLAGYLLQDGRYCLLAWGQNCMGINNQY